MTSPANKSDSMATLFRSSAKDRDPILIFQCLNPWARYSLASATSFSGEPPSIRNNGMGSGSARWERLLSARKYFHKGMDLLFVKRSNKAISTQDLAEALPYKMLEKTPANSFGSPQSQDLAPSAKYFTLPKRLSKVSPVMSGATEASPQPSRPSSSVKQRRTVLASRTNSRAILIGSMSGIESG